MPGAAAGAPTDFTGGGAAGVDAQLAYSARAGDRGAFEELYRRFAPAVHGILVASAPRTEARDLVQEVFLLALRSIRRLEDPARIGPWLCTIARNLARDAHKKSRARGELDENLAAPEADAAPDDEEEAERALAALRTLPDAYRETLALRLVEGLSGPEIAERTGLTHGSVRVNLHRGMKLLRERLGEEGTR